MKTHEQSCADSLDSKLGVSQAGTIDPAMHRVPQPQPPIAFVNHTAETPAVIRGWLQEHRVAVIVVLLLQMICLFVAAGSVYWFTRKRGN